MGRRATTKTATLDASTRVALIVGEDAYLQHEYVEQLRRAIEDAHPDADSIRFDGDSATVAEVLDECRTFGLMAPHKLVVVDGADALIRGEDARNAFLRYAESPNDSTTLVLRARAWHAGKLDKKLKASGWYVKCDSPSEHQAVNWAVKRCNKRHDADLPRDVAIALVERIGPDLGRLDSEIAKLAAAAAGKGEPISRELVTELVGVSREEEVWGLQSTILSGNVEASLAYLRTVLDVSRQSPVLVNYACCDLARKLHGVAVGAQQRLGPGDLARELRLWGESKDFVLRSGRRLGPTTTARLLHDAVDTDAAGKSGRGDPIRNLETLVARFASAMG